MKVYPLFLSILLVLFSLLQSIFCIPLEMGNSNGNMKIIKKEKSDGDSTNSSSDHKNIYLADSKTGERVAKWNESMKNNPYELGSYYQGDILQPAGTHRNGKIDERYRWLGGVIPYVIQGSFNQQQLNLIYGAMNDYHHYTCIKFIPRTNQRDYIRILSGNSGCWSSVGRVGGVQDLNLQIPGCVTLKGTPVHELMHAVGFEHEQSRLDRDNYVTIQYQNVQNGLAYAFDKVPQTTSFGEPYDYHSVMHYTAYAFSKNNKPTIVPKHPVQGELGQRYGFSQTDVNRIWKMYKCQRTTIGG